MAVGNGYKTREIAKWFLRHQPVEGRPIAVVIDENGLLTFSCGDDLLSFYPNEWEGLWTSMVIGAVVAEKLGFDT